MNTFLLNELIVQSPLAFDLLTRRGAVLGLLFHEGHSP